MATIDELVQQYETDPELRKEVEQILADGKITIKEFTAFAKKHQVNVSVMELPGIISKAKKLGML